MHIKLGPGALSGFTWKNPCKQPWPSVTKISKLILFRGFQLVSYFKTTKTSEYNRIIILDQESYQIFLKRYFEFKKNLLQKANEDQKWSLRLHKKFFSNSQSEAFLVFI